MFAHYNVLLNKCAQFRQEGSFTDVQLKVGRTVFPAHRIILAAYSDYFYAMFTNGMKESSQEVIELKDESMSPETLKQIIDFIYSGCLHINDENVFQVLAVADHLQITSVLQQCCDFLKTAVIQDVRRYRSLCAIANKYGLKELQEAADHQMALNYKDICESQEFLSYFGTDQLLSLLSRDDLSAPSETFVFRSVMQWIKHKKEERMAVAARVIETVRLGLVDTKVLISELNTRDMQRLPDIHKVLFDALIYSHVPSQVPRFAEKSKPRDSKQVLLAICPQSSAKQFDVVNKHWEGSRPTLNPPKLTTDWRSPAVYCAAVHVSNYLYVAVKLNSNYYVYCYNIHRNLWEKQPQPQPQYVIHNLCAIGDYVYAIGDYMYGPQRYSVSQHQWQPISGLGCSENTRWAFYAGATVFDSRLYVIYGYAYQSPAILYCFDSSVNCWTTVSRTCEPHFRSTLFVVNNKLCVAGGHKCVSIPERVTFIAMHNNYCRDPQFGGKACVEVYDFENSFWSVVQQNHINIPQNELGAIVVEGRLYFIINRFPIDSGIRIPTGDVHPADLSEWATLSNVSTGGVLCHFPIKN